MSDTLGVATKLVQGAWKLREIITSLASNQKELYKLAAKLIDQIQDLEDLRKGHVSSSVAELDVSLSSLESDLNTIICECEKLLRDNFGSRKSLSRLTKVDKVKESIRELRDDVRDAYLRYLGRNSAAASIKQCSTDAAIQIGFSKLSMSMDAHFQEAKGDQGKAEKLFGINQMNGRQRRESLQKATLDRNAAGTDLEVQLINLKIRTIEMALKKNPTILEYVETAEYRQSYLPGIYIPDYSNPRKKREDALIETIALLQLVTGDSSITEDVPAISWFQRAINLSSSLRSLGLRDEALQFCTIAHNVIRKLSESNLSFFKADLALSLHNLSNRLGDMGYRDEALGRNQEAVTMYRELAEQNLGSFASDLALSLVSLSVCFSGMGRREEALDCIREAVTMYRTLAERNPGAFTIELAGSLLNVSTLLSDMGRKEEALERSQESVTMHRELAGQNLSALTPGFASSLLNLSNRLSDMGRKEEALECIQEVVRLRSLFAEQNANAFAPDLARSLHNLSVLLSDMGRKEEALERSQEAVSMCRELAGESPSAFTPELAGSLHNLSLRLSDMGRREEALESTQEAVQLGRKLAEQNPGAFNHNLAASLWALSCRCSDFGENGKALTAIRESADLYGILAEKYPDAFNKDFAGSLKELQHCLHRAGKVDEAQEVWQKADAVRRQMALETWTSRLVMCWRILQ